MWQAYNLASFSGYDPIYPKSYANFLISSLAIKKPTRYFENDEKTLSIFQNMGLKYIFTINKNTNNLQNNGWKEVYQEKSVSVLENTKYTPPYGLTTKSKLDYVKLLAHFDDSWEFIVENKLPTTFYLIENNYPGWHVLVNGQPKNISNYLGTFKSVNLDPGINKLLFQYKNNSLNYGSLISLCSFIVTILLGYYYHHNHE